MSNKSLALLLTSTFVLTTLTARGKSAEEKKVEEQEKKAQEYRENRRK